MLKNIRTSTELVTDNEHSKITNLIRKENKHAFNLRHFGKKGCQKMDIQPFLKYCLLYA